MSGATQTNTRTGDLPVIAGEDLTDKEGYLVALGDDSGLVALLPTAISDLALFVVVDEAEAAAVASLRPLEIGRNLRVKLKGTCSPGDQLVLADPATPADAGKLRVLPATAGVYNVLAIAEEAGVDGQLLRIRPAITQGVQVATELDLTSTNGLAVGLSFSATVAQAEAEALAAEVEKVGDDVRAMHAALVAQGLLVTS